MRHLRLTAAVAVGLIVPAGAAAATAPHWTASGKVTALSARSITVHGKTCHIVTTAPIRRALRLFDIGTTARISCSNGILRTIAHPGSTTGAAPAVGTTSGSSSPMTSSAASSPPVTSPPSAPVAPGPATISGGGPPGTA